MASTSASTRGEFERQRGELIKEIAESFEHVLANINKLNRNLEAVITVGNEFSSVEALWSTFENVMGKEEGEGEGGAEAEAEGTGREDGVNTDGAMSEVKEELEQEEDSKAQS